MSQNNGNKVMSAKEAVSRFVNDGEELIIGNYTVGTCCELIYEICRQGKKGFTVFSQSGILDVDVLVNAGAVDRLVSTYVLRSGGKKGVAPSSGRCRQGRSNGRITPISIIMPGWLPGCTDSPSFRFWKA